jgi:SAM-dependent methyltransferase
MDWDQYARCWNEDRSFVPIEDPSVAEDGRDSYLNVLGDEWGDKRSVDDVVARFILPHVSRTSDVLEVGCGGGRIARRVIEHCRSLVCGDTSPTMLSLTASALQPYANLTFQLLDGRHLVPPFAPHRFDFVYCFDVFVHLHSREIFSYLEEFRKVLRPTGKLMLHYATIETAAGWAHFRKSASAGVAPLQFGSFEYMAPSQLNRYYKAHRFRLIEASGEDESNFYLRRDLLHILEPE